MSTILAGRRTFAQEIASELRQRLRALLTLITRPDVSDDESSTRFSWPRAL
jgi:hypothetical protein